MRYLYKIITITLLLFIVKTQAQTELSDYLIIGAENNLGLKAKFSEYNAALEKVPQVGTLPDPQLSFDYFISPIETRLGPQRAKLGIRQMFPWFGTLNAKEDIYIEISKAKFEAFEEAKSKLFFDIKSLYYNVYFIQKGIEITKENIRILNTFQQLSIIKIETGKASVVDEMRVEMEINELLNQLAYLIDHKYVIEVKFNNLLNRTDNSSVVLPTILSNDSLLVTKKDLLNSIITENHLIKQLEYKIRSWKNQEVIAKKKGMPQFSIGVDYVFIGNSSNLDLGSENGRDALILPKVGITIPLYRKKYKALVKEASFKMQENQFKKEDKKNQLSSLFEKGYKDYKDADRRVDLYLRQLKLAKKSLNILLTGYSTNGENFEEVLRMERKVLKYSLEVDKARADKNATVAFITYLMGN